MLTLKVKDLKKNHFFDPVSQTFVWQSASVSISAVVPANPWGAVFHTPQGYVFDCMQICWGVEWRGKQIPTWLYFGIFIVLDSFTVSVQKGWGAGIIPTPKGEFVGLFKSETLLTFPAPTFSLHLHLYFLVLLCLCLALNTLQNICASPGQ